MWETIADVTIRLMVILAIIEVLLMIVVYIDNHKPTHEEGDDD